MIFFGSDSGTIYSIDINGSLHDGYPVSSSDTKKYVSALIRLIPIKAASAISLVCINLVSITFYL